MFESLRARNFKSWRVLPNFRLAPITGLFGSNSSGKTSILQMLLLMKQTAESVDRSQAFNFGDEAARIQLGSLKDVLFEHDLTAELEIGFGWQARESLHPPDPVHPERRLFEESHINFSTVVKAGVGARPVVDRFRYHAGDNSVEMSRASQRQGRRQSEYNLEATINGQSDYLKRSQGRPWPLPQPVKSYGFPDEVAAYFQNSGFAADFELELDRNFSDNLYYLGPLRSTPARQYQWQGSQPQDVGISGERAIEALLASRDRGRSNARSFDARGRARKRITVEQHVAEWLKDLNLIDEFLVRRLSEDADIYQVLVKQRYNQEYVSLRDVGFGVSQVLPVLVLLAWAPEGSTVLLEQPEIHLHPAVQSSLADVFIEAAESRRVQIIVESHSEHLIRRLQLRVAELSVSATQIVLYFCERSRSGSVMKDLGLNAYGEIENWPRDFFGDPFGETAAIVRAALGARRKAELQSIA